MRKVGLLITGLLLHLSNPDYAQVLQPDGRFQKDTVKVGEEVNYILTFHYPSEKNIVFPDTSYNYFPFELLSKKYFPTRSDSTHSIDSVVYTLATYEVDSIQYLSLPVFEVNEEDSIKYFSGPKSVVLDHVVKEIPRPLALKGDVEAAELNKAWNYPYFIIGMSVFLLIAVIVVVLFGKTAIRKYKVYRLRKKHNKFAKQFLQMMGDLSADSKPSSIEHALGFWKKYMERLDKLPVTKMTTKELVHFYDHETIKSILKGFDRCIYGDVKPNDIVKECDKLLHFSGERVDKKIEEINSK